MGTYLERGLSAYSVTICDMGYKSRWAYPYMFYMFRAAQSVGTSTCITIKQTIIIMLIFLVALLKRHVTINPLLTSTSDSTSPDKLLKFPSYMPLFGEKD